MEIQLSFFLILFFRLLIEVEMSLLLIKTNHKYQRRTEISSFTENIQKNIHHIYVSYYSFTSYYKVYYSLLCSLFLHYVTREFEATIDRRVYRYCAKKEEGVKVRYLIYLLVVKRDQKTSVGGID